MTCDLSKSRNLLTKKRLNDQYRVTFKSFYNVEKVYKTSGF